MPKSRQLRSSADIIASAMSSLNGRAMSRVGTMWSTVPKVRDGNRTVQPRCRSSSNACGVVTS